MNGKALFACIVLSGALASCIPRRAWTTEDSWYNPPSQGALVGQGQGLVLQLERAPAEVFVTCSMAK